MYRDMSKLNGNVWASCDALFITDVVSIILISIGWKKSFHLIWTSYIPRDGWTPDIHNIVSVLRLKQVEKKRLFGSFL